MLPQTIKVMKKLRELNKTLDNSIKISDWVDSYLDQCRLKNESITIITPWSLSPRFEKRYINQGNCFLPTRKEIRLFQKEIPYIISFFKEGGFSINWWIIFSRSYLDSRLLSRVLEEEYFMLIQTVSEKHNLPVVFLNFEDDVTGQRHSPEFSLLEENNFERVINKDQFNYEFERWTNWVKEEGLNISDEEIIKQTKYQIACEAKEGKFFMQDSTNPISKPGEFLFLPLGRAERYVFFSSLVPEFEKRIVCVLKPYPWRI